MTAPAPPDPPDPLPTRPVNYWLARLSFSFFIVGGWLAWEAYKVVTIAHQDGAPMPVGRVSLYLVAAVLSFAMGGAGVRERHRREL